MRKLRVDWAWLLIGLLAWAAGAYAVSITAMGALTVTSIVNTGSYTGTIGTGTPSAGAFTTLSSSVSDSLGGGYLSETRVVTAALTTTAGLLVKTATTGNTVSTASLADVGVGGIAITSQAAGQNVEVAIKGVTTCVADNTTVIGNMLGVGTATAGRCRDLGAASSLGIRNDVQIIGKALSVATVGNSVTVQIYSQGIYGSGASSSLTAPFFVSGAADPADAGAIRLGNNESILWEKNAAGTDFGFTLDTANTMQLNTGLVAADFIRSTSNFFQGNGYNTNTICTDSAGPAACGANTAGRFVIDAAATSVVVSTTAVSATSQIFVMYDSGLGTALGVTCNTTVAIPSVTARTNGTSFTVTVPVAPTVNPACYSYFLFN